MKSMRERAAHFFALLAAGAPLSNVTWGKSRREIRDYCALAAQSLKEESLQHEQDCAPVAVQKTTKEGRPT